MATFDRWSSQSNMRSIVNFIRLLCLRKSLLFGQKRPHLANCLTSRNIVTRGNYFREQYENVIDERVNSCLSIWFPNSLFNKKFQIFSNEKKVDLFWTLNADQSLVIFSCHWTLWQNPLYSLSQLQFNILKCFLNENFLCSTNLFNDFS